MTSPRLSPAMRQMLRNATAGANLATGMYGGTHKLAQTRTALKARGLIDTDGRSTEAGRAVFAPRKLEGSLC